MVEATVRSVPGAFIWRRIHSLTGLWLVIFLFEHLITNSQAALLWGEQARGFVRLVNLLHNLPALRVIEVVLLGFPLLVHAFWGVRYLVTGRLNALPGEKNRPRLGRFALNQGYTWMRITAVIMGVGLIGHVVQMRFVNYPDVRHEGAKTYFSTRVTPDARLPEVAKELGAELKIGTKGMVVEADNFGTAIVLMVRETFKSPLYRILYSVFLLASCFHAAHGFWTFLMTWGVVLKQAAQHRIYFLALTLLVLLSLLGLVAIWGSA